jgi:hypothetical protein
VGFAEGHTSRGGANIGESARRRHDLRGPATTRQRVHTRSTFCFSNRGCTMQASRPPGPPPRQPQSGPSGRSQAATELLPSRLGRPQAKRERRPRRRLPMEETTLVCLLKSQVGQRVTLELRNDTLVEGLLEDVDDWMK